MLTVTLALRDLLRDRLFLLCNVAVLAGVLVPLLILLGVKNGVYEALIGQLLSNPATLQIDTQGNAELTEAEIAPLRDWSEIAFLTPRTRSQFDYVNLYAPEGSGAALREALLLPTGAGDPNLPPGMVLAEDEIALSPLLARQMALAEGDQIELVTQAETRPRQLRLRVTVRHILPETVASGRSVMADFAVLDRVEAFYDNYALPEFGVTEGRPLAERQPRFEGLRVYARSLESLGPLQERLEAELGIGTSAKTREVAAVLGLGRNLDLALGLTSALAATGLVAALLFGFWSDAMRKRGALAALGMLGLPPRSLALFPVVQAMVTAVLGLMLSFALYAGGAALAARMFAQGLPGEAPVTRLEWPQGMAICAAVLCIVLVAAVASAWSALRVDPARTLREGH